jgi:hypothetical protein
MAIPLFFAAVIPASLWSARLLQSGGTTAAPLRAALLALLALGGWNVSRLYASQGHAPYAVEPAFVRELAGWVKQHTPPGARFLFAGKCVHYYGRGHIAYLPRYAEREMMACDYYAFPPGTVEYNYPPAFFRKPEDRLFPFMELYNVTHIVTYHDNWKEAFRRHPDQFEEAHAFSDGRAVAFRVLREPEQFLRGSGSARATFNRIDVRLDSPSQVAVLKYNWVDGLSVKAPVELFPFDTGVGIRLIGVRPNGRSEFSIRFRSWL